jgi:isoleucyl-tRNA synthetase
MSLNDSDHPDRSTSRSLSPFRKVDARATFPELEQAVLELWDELDAFQESNRRRAGGPPFVF